MKNQTSLLTVFIVFLGLIINPISFANNKNFTYAHGAIIRGDTNKKEIALVFTGDNYADGADYIIKVLRDENIKAAFFLTGNFYREFKSVVRHLKHDRHYLGAHSDKHLLCCDWKNRNKLLISKSEYNLDIVNNFKEMKKFGIARKDAKYLLPAYEWYNATISEWANELGLTLINFTPGTKSNADYMTPDLKGYMSSAEIVKNILDYEKNNPNGLNGFILLFHIGTEPERTDKFYFQLKDLITELKKRNYSFKRIDELLK